MTSYDIGTKPLFDDRVEDVIIHDPRVQSELPTRKPDRVFGLRKTKAFETALNVLDESVAEYSPFKACDDPLILPFLILEAKQEKSSDSFEDIQNQTAFPIWALLRLQENLRFHTAEQSSSVSPLVWFLANRGDYWRLYGCCTTNNPSKKYVRFG